MPWLLVQNAVALTVRRYRGIESWDIEQAFPGLKIDYLCVPLPRPKCRAMPPPMGAADCRLARSLLRDGLPGCWLLCRPARRVACCVLSCWLRCVPAVYGVRCATAGCATATTGRACAGLRCAVRCCCVSVGGRGAIYLFSCPALSCLCAVCCCCLRSLAPAPPAHRVTVCLLCITLILAIRSRSLIRYSVPHSLHSALRYRTACCVAYAAYRYCYTQQLLSFNH